MSISTPFEVSYWGSKPGENDDCYSSGFCDTLLEALWDYWGPHPKNVAWIELIAPEGRLMRPNPAYVPSPPESDDDWRREAAMQAGMGLGVEAYNDTMGY